MTSHPVTARRTLAVASLFLLSTFGLILALVESRWPPLRRVDLAAAADLHRYAAPRPALTDTAQVLSTIGSAPAWTAVLTIAVGWLIWRRRLRIAIFVAVTAITSSLVNELVKWTVDRPRPVLPGTMSAAGSSFPSGHAQAAVVGFGVLSVALLPLLPRAVQIAWACTATVMITAIGFARISLGVHYVSDVFAGYALGAAWLTAMIALFGVWPCPRKACAAQS